MCANHASHMDSAMLMASTGRRFHECGMVAAKDYFFDGPQGAYLSRLMNLVPVDRECTRATLRDYVSQCRSFFDNGKQILIVFPEGTRSMTGELQEFRRGAGILGVELGLPVVPVYVRGSFRAWPKGKSLIRPGRVSVHLGATLTPPERAESTRVRFVAYSAFTQEVEAAVRRLAESQP